MPNFSLNIAWCSTVFRPQTQLKRSLFDRLPDASNVTTSRCRATSQGGELILCVIGTRQSPCRTTTARLVTYALPLITSSIAWQNS